MTAWDNSGDPEGMLEALRDGGRWSDRKLRLFAVARCRCVWGLLADVRSRQAVEVAERYAEGLGDWAARAAAEASARAAYAEALDKWAHDLPVHAAEPDPWAAARNCASRRGPSNRHRWDIAALLRDIFGNPFRRVALDPAWLTPAVAALAQAAYDERLPPSGELDPTPLAVLGDALEDAGCANTDILRHLRAGGHHFLGCWVIDLLLGRE
jgi:hypothetical protein